MSSTAVKIQGSDIRKRLRNLGLPGGSETRCCGGRLKFSRDYESQLKSLKLRGRFKVLEGGVVVADIVIA